MVRGRVVVVVLVEWGGGGRVGGGIGDRWGDGDGFW